MSLAGFVGRSVWETTLGAIRREVGAELAGPVFIKPLTETKSFSGCVVTRSAELERLQHFEDELRILAAEPVTFLSEWRYYIHRSAVVGIANYKGEWSSVPESAIVRQAMSAYVNAPVAYSLDFGITAEGRTLLVEANGAVALGAHGIDAVAYAKMLEERWLEITGG